MSTNLDLLNSKYTAFVASDAGNDVVFNDAGVSRRHCQISKVGDNNFLVADLRSATGTFVNKCLIIAFTTIGNGILLFIYIIAQIIAYSYSKKFFHDQLSNTVIGERSS